MPFQHFTVVCGFDDGWSYRAGDAKEIGVLLEGGGHGVGAFVVRVARLILWLLAWSERKTLRPVCRNVFPFPFPRYFAVIFSACNDLRDKLLRSENKKYQRIPPSPPFDAFASLSCSLYRSDVVEAWQAMDTDANAANALSKRATRVRRRAFDDVVCLHPPLR